VFTSCYHKEFNFVCQIESVDGYSQRLMVDTFSAAADVALHDAAAIKASDDTKSMLADIAGCGSTTTFSEVHCCQLT
jgi:hypothetical protein